jgi:Ca-activated chloride channel homolog
MTGSLVFLTPSAALVVFAAVLPLLAVAVAGRRVAAARRQLRLPAPAPVRRLGTVVALVAVIALLALAAAQPALRSTTSARVRTDAQAIFVLDVSRSMMAAGSANSPTRLARAKRAAIALRNAIPEVPSGVATMTDRTLPSLFPNADPAVFDNTVLHSVAIEQPPPGDQYVVATSLAALGALGTQNYFPPTARRRLVVVLTDGESRPFDPRALARQLNTGPGIHLVLVHVSAPGENVYDNGRIEAGYHEDPASAQTLASLAAATGGSSFSEHSLGSAIHAEKAALGKGPTIVVGKSQRTTTLAPYAALLALVPLTALLLRGVRLGRRRLPSPDPVGGQQAAAVTRPGAVAHT